ncbi:hypothetical protein [Thioalkalivibrio sp. XN8]|uniref:hypothetical protein n=1 Tax=Thioalkalivibrio sp. XN8 TaxID=2712863 RepID=UPI0013ECDAC1|nr:hypothetical protein [Thioalkalivibrio sp. XN8]NGP53479.1 hypothetical protein [Thioalkalivibrio sp. XN8]
MNKLIKQACIAAALALLATPLTTTAQERQVAPPERKPQAGLLLPAVQKAQDQGQEQEPNEEERVMPHYHGPIGGQAQQGIEPDEIDAAARDRAATAPAPRGRVDKATPMRGPAAGGRALTTQQMMAKLQPSAHRASSHRRILPMAATQGNEAGSGPTSVQQPRPSEPPKYEIEECGTATNPAICCHHEAGDGSSCNLFIMLCEHHGGTGKGDGESAICSDW